MRTAALRARPLEPAGLGRPPLAVLIVGLCVIWCWNLVERIFVFIESVLWPQSAQTMSNPQPSRRCSWLGALLCCRSDDEIMDTSTDAPSSRGDQQAHAAASSPGLTGDRSETSAVDGSEAVAVASLISVAAGSPPHWDPIDPAHGNSTLVLLSKDNPKHAAELAHVEQNWSCTGGLGALVAVHRIQNHLLHRRYESWKRSHSRRHQERIVYHGTRDNPPALIYQSEAGFDPAFGRAEPGHLWFAEDASYSSDGYEHCVSRSLLPFCPSKPPSSSDFGQILLAKIWINPATSEKLNGDQEGVHLISKSQQALPTHLLTFQRYRY